MSEPIIKENRQKDMKVIEREVSDVIDISKLDEEIFKGVKDLLKKYGHTEKEINEFLLGQVFKMLNSGSYDRKAWLVHIQGN